MDNDATKAGHTHPEAFCLMMYQCERCREREVLWNSRDGVTPFTLTCQVCGGTMQHITWGADQYSPDYKPVPGQRYFIDLTKESYFKFLRSRFPDWNKKQMNAAWKDVETGAPDIATEPYPPDFQTKDMIMDFKVASDPPLSSEGEAPLTRSERRRRMFHR